MIITLDGPCGSGKSTLAQLLAQKLGYFYINSGYLYRSLAYLLVREFGYDEQMLCNPNLADIAIILNEHNFEYVYQDGIAQILYRGYEITGHLKTSLVSHHASIVSAHAGVRAAIVPIQRKLAQQYDVVTDGRDCGTEIYPQAHFKFYIIASPEIRAARLHQDLQRKGVQTSFDEVLQTTIARDLRDMNRAVCPLKKAETAIEIDSSDKAVQEILDAMLAMIKKSQ